MWSLFTPRLRRFFSSLARMIIVVEFNNNLNFKNKCGCFSEWAWAKHSGWFFISLNTHTFELILTCLHINTHIGTHALLLQIAPKKSAQVENIFWGFFKCLYLPSAVGFVPSGKNSSYLLISLTECAQIGFQRPLRLNLSLYSLSKGQQCPLTLVCKASHLRPFNTLTLEWGQLSREVLLWIKSSPLIYLYQSKKSLPFKSNLYQRKQMRN